MCFSSRVKVTEYPHPDNNYFVEFIDPTDPGWVNPHGSSNHLKPYKPKAERAYSNITFDRSALIFCSDFFRSHYAILEPEDLHSFSEASKSCYLAIKPNLIWEIQMKKFLPNVTCLPKNHCLLTPRQQFQIIFKTVHDRKKPFKVQLQHNFEKIKEFETSLAGIEVFLKNMKLSKEHRTYVSSPEHIHLRHLVGSKYDGSICSIDPASQQGRCLAALRFIHQEFDNPKKFKNTLVSSECACIVF